MLDNICFPLFCSESPVADERTNFFAHQHSVASEFIQALWFAVIANTDVAIYLLIFLNTIISMNVQTLSMSLLVCLWGTLIKPRPAKHFWLMIIAYTEVGVKMNKHNRFEFDR